MYVCSHTCTVLVHAHNTRVLAFPCTQTHTYNTRARARGHTRALISFGNRYAVVGANLVLAACVRFLLYLNCKKLVCHCQDRALRQAWLCRGRALRATGLVKPGVVKPGEDGSAGAPAALVPWDQPVGGGPARASSAVGAPWQGPASLPAPRMGVHTSRAVCTPLGAPLV